MPGKKSKKFIDKKGSVTFHLVHRSQKDPLQADDDAPDHVLLEERRKAQKEEQQKYGIYYDDDYDYTQHLRDVNELSEVEPLEVFRVSAKETNKPKETQIKLPSSVFGTDYETDVGLLNKAAPLRGPQLDWDPDIVAGLDEDFDFDNPDNQLEDDFIQKANAEDVLSDEEADDGGGGGEIGTRPQQEAYSRKPGSLRINNEDEDCPSDEADEDFDDEETLSDMGSFGGRSFDSEETKTGFTNYSMTSSVIRRNEGLTLLDDRFEKFYEQYDDEEIGALDHEEIMGYVPENSTVLNSVLDEFEEQQKQIKLKDAVEKAEDADVVSESESSDDEIIIVTEPDKTEKWDCESILSSYSTLYNHPKLISQPKKEKAIKLTKRGALPAGVLPEKASTQKQLEKQKHQANKNDRVCTYRPKDETAEEKRQRKQAIKQERKTRREEKKSNKQAFKEERNRQQKEILNLKQNLQGVKIA